MLRITLGGPGLAGFADAVGGYVKLNLPSDGGKPLIRTYTVAAQREDEIDCDFALHGLTGTGHAGPATQWALDCAAGDTILIGGPGPAKPLEPAAPFYLVAGDMTALPAIAVNLAALPADARGVAVIEVMDDADCQPLAKPAGVDLHWVIVPQPGSKPDALAAAVREIDLPDGVQAWVACEFSAMQRLRAYLRDERGLGPDQLYISSYWKSGLTEDAHKVAKREDAMAS
jgi:NADPH-dependent ferric siderophore reductase